MEDPFPPGWHTVTPRLVVQDTEAMVDFLRRAFGGAGDYQAERPSEIRIGDSIVMVSGVGVRAAMPGCLYLYVDDVDATYERSLALGAASMEEPKDVPYGDRRAMVQDPCGNVWQIATRLVRD